MNTTNAATRKARAIVIEQHSKYELSDAKRFGRITYLFRREEYRSSIWSKEYVKEVLDALQHLDYDPEIDYIVIVGYQVTLTLAISAILTRYRRIQVLLYSAVEQKYIPRTLGE